MMNREKDTWEKASRFKLEDLDGSQLDKFKRFLMSGLSDDGALFRSNEDTSITQIIRLSGGICDQNVARIEDIGKILEYWGQILYDTISDRDVEILVPASGFSSGSFKAEIVINTNKPMLVVDCIEEIKQVYRISSDLSCMKNEFEFFKMPRKYKDLLMLISGSDFSIEINNHKNDTFFCLDSKSANKIIDNINTMENEFQSSLIKVRGTLVGANVQTRRFRIVSSEENNVILGLAKKGENDIFIGLVLGQEYEFYLSSNIREDGTNFFILESAKDIFHKKSFDPNLIPTRLIPQGNRLQCVIEYVTIIHNGQNPEKMMNLSARTIHYYKNSCISLELIDKDDKLTEKGIQLCSSDDKYSTLCVLFESSPCGVSWLEWDGASDITKLDTKKAFDFLKENTILRGTTLERRADTLQSWVNQLKIYHPSGGKTDFLFSF